MSEKYRHNAFFNGVSSFKSAFPDLADALVEWRELRGPEDERPSDARKTGHRRGNFTQGMLPCSNPTCHEGGYQIDRLIADMVAQGEMEREGTLLCAGREMGDETRRGPIRCPHRIVYKIVLSKREGPERPERSKRFRRRRRPNRGNAA